MPAETLENTPYPDGTEVGAYDATGWTGGFPGANPPGTAVATATASGRKVTFTELEYGVAYRAGAKVNGEWRYVDFSIDAPTNQDLAVDGMGVCEYDEDAGEWPPRGNYAVVTFIDPTGEAATPAEMDNSDLLITAV